MGARVVGLDGCKGGWIAAVVDGGRLVAVEFRASARAALDACADAAVLAFDIPIGLSLDGRRKADIEAKDCLGKHGNRVFYAPIRAALDARTLDDAHDASKRITGSAIQPTSAALLPKIREVDEFAGDARVYEAHPEVSFAAMNGGPLASRKKMWNGLMQRLALLAARGLAIPEAPDALGEAGERGAPDDIADAVACAWTAARIARGEARSLPDPPERIKCGPPRGTAIWY